MGGVWLLSPFCMTYLEDSWELPKETEKYPTIPACALHTLTKKISASLVEQIHKHFQNKSPPAHKDI